MGSDRQKIGDLFASFMDEDRVEALGAEPIADDLAAIDAVTDVGALVELLGRFQREGSAARSAATSNTDDRQSDRYIVNIVQGGIGLPDEAYYREDGFAEVRDQYVAHVAAMLRLLGWSDADADRRRGAASWRSRPGWPPAHWDRVRCRDVHRHLQPHHARRAAGRGAGVRLVALDRRLWAAPTPRSPRCWCASRATSRRCPRRSPRCRSTTGRCGSTFHLVSECRAAT